MLWLPRLEIQLSLPSYSSAVAWLCPWFHLMTQARGKRVQVGGRGGNVSVQACQGKKWKPRWIERRDSAHHEREPLRPPR